MEVKKLDEFSEQDLRIAKLLKLYFDKGKFEITGEVADSFYLCKKFVYELEGRVEFMVNKQKKEKFMEKDIIKPIEQVEKKTRRKKA